MTQTTQMVHEWELQWYNGNEYETCLMYSFDKDPDYVVNKFMSDVYDDETVEDLSISYEGEVEDYEHYGTF